MSKNNDFDVDGVKYRVLEPSLEQNRQAQMAYNRAFGDALGSKSPLRVQVADILKERGLWNDDKQAELDKLNKDILEKEYTLNSGGILKSQARDIAIQLRNLRLKLQDLFTPISNFDSVTCEAQARNARFDYLVSVCVVYDDGRPYFSSYEDYINRGNEPVAVQGANKFAEIHWKLTEDFQDELVENQFLKDHGFADDKYRLIDSKGRLISEDGRLVNEDGNLVDEEGNIINILGHKLDKDGKLIVERKPFLDDSADIVKDSARKKSNK